MQAGRSIDEIEMLSSLPNINTQLVVPSIIPPYAMIGPPETSQENNDQIPNDVKQNAQDETTLFRGVNQF